MARILLDDDSLTDQLTSVVGGVWQTADEIGSIYIGGSATVVGVTHVKFSLNFTGTSIAFYGHILGDERPTNDSYNLIIVDTLPTANIFVPQSTVVDLWYETPSMPDNNATHNITLVDFPTMLIDYAVVTAGRETPLTGQTLLADDTDDAIEYAGSWMRSSSVIKGANATSRAPVGGSTYGTGTAVSVYGISPSDDGVVMNFTLDGNVSRMNQYNATLHDPNFLWYSQHNLLPGNHTLVMQFASDTSARNFTLDYITYIPSFSTLASKPNFPLASTTPVSASTNNPRRTIIGAVVGPTTFLFIVLVILYWKKRWDVSKRLKLSSLEAIPYNFTSTSDSDGSTRSLVPSTSTLPGLSPSTELPNNSPMLEVQRKPRHPEHPTSRQIVRQSDTSRPFLQEVRKPPLPQTSRPSTTEQDRPALQPQHKHPLPGLPSRPTQGVYDAEPEPLEAQQKSPLPGQLPRRGPVSRDSNPEPLQEQHKSRLPDESTRRPHSGRVNEPLLPLEEVHKPTLPGGRTPPEDPASAVQEQRKPILPGRSQSAEAHDGREGAATVREQHKSPIAGTSTRAPGAGGGGNVRASATGPPPEDAIQRDDVPHAQEQHKPRLTAPAAEDIRGERRADENAASLRIRTAQPHPTPVPVDVLQSATDSPQSPTRRRTRWLTFQQSEAAHIEPFMLPGPGTPSSKVQEHRKSPIAGLSSRAPAGQGEEGNVRGRASGTPDGDIPGIQEQRKPRLTVHSGEDIREERRVAEATALVQTPVDNHPRTPGVQSPIIRSATDSAQSPTTRRKTRWRAFRRRPPAHIEPFLLPSPSTNPSNEHQTPVNDHPSTLSRGREEQNVSGGGERVRLMLESANVRLTVLENVRADQMVPPPPYQSDA
ncbi:hypothetical protein DXG01_014331 [Tephrocybe rancida]|nr:hypothetical protein DXG01_014331 [Tephrocybe rancida]